MRLLLQFSFSSSLMVYLSSLAILRCMASTLFQARSPISFSTRSKTVFSSSSRLSCRLSTMFSTISLSIYRNLRHRSSPILLRPYRKCSVSRMRLLKTEIRSAGLATDSEEACPVPLEGSLPVLVFSFSLESELPFSNRSTLCLVVLLVLRECFPERVRDRQRVCAVLLRQGPKGSGECSRSYLSLLRLYRLRFLTKSSRLRSWCLEEVYFLLACRCIQRLQHQNSHIEAIAHFR